MKQETPSISAALYDYISFYSELVSDDYFEQVAKLTADLDPQIAAMTTQGAETMKLIQGIAKELTLPQVNIENFADIITSHMDKGELSPNFLISTAIENGLITEERSTSEFIKTLLIAQSITGDTPPDKTFFSQAAQLWLEQAPDSALASEEIITDIYIKIGDAIQVVQYLLDHTNFTSPDAKRLRNFYNMLGHFSSDLELSTFMSSFKKGSTLEATESVQQKTPISLSRNTKKIISIDLDHPEFFNRPVTFVLNTNTSYLEQFNHRYESAKSALKHGEKILAAVEFYPQENSEKTHQARGISFTKKTRYSVFALSSQGRIIPLSTLYKQEEIPNQFSTLRNLAIRTINAINDHSVKIVDIPQIIQKQLDSNDQRSDHTINRASREITDQTEATDNTHALFSQMLKALESMQIPSVKSIKHSPSLKNKPQAKQQTTNAVKEIRRAVRTLSRVKQNTWKELIAAMQSTIRANSHADLDDQKKAICVDFIKYTQELGILNYEGYSNDEILRTIMLAKILCQSLNSSFSPLPDGTIELILMNRVRTIGFNSKVSTERQTLKPLSLGDHKSLQDLCLGFDIEFENVEYRFNDCWRKIQKFLQHTLEVKDKIALDKFVPTTGTENLRTFEIRRRTNKPVKIKIKKYPHFNSSFELWVHTDENSTDHKTLEMPSEIVAFCSFVPTEKNMQINRERFNLKTPKRSNLIQHSFGIGLNGELYRWDHWQRTSSEITGDRKFPILNVCGPIIDYINDPEVEVIDIQDKVETKLNLKSERTDPVNNDVIHSNSSENPEFAGLDDLPKSQTIDLNPKEPAIQTGKSIDDLVKAQNKKPRNHTLATTTRILAYNHRKNKPMTPSESRFDAAGDTSLYIRIYKRATATEKAEELTGQKVRINGEGDLYTGIKDLISMVRTQFPDEHYQVRCETFVDLMKSKTEQRADEITERVEGEIAE